MATRVRSHAKINLGLGIGAPREDGFHGLATVYQTLEMHDVVTVTARAAAETAIRITSNDARVPLDGRNTCWKMVELALKLFQRNAEVDIHIQKELPIQGGLGAGSANAVAALVGLEVELGVHARSFFTQRLALAAEVGSDVPLFLIGGTVLGVDRGQEVYPLPDIEPVCCVVATPAVGVSTPQAFRDWDAVCAAEGLTAERSADRLKMLSRAYAGAFAGGIPRGAAGLGSSGVPGEAGDRADPEGYALVRTGITSWIANDFERVVFRQHPSLAEIKRILWAAGTPEAALYASLSGSGSALYGLYATRGEGEAACARLQAAGVAANLTRTLPRREYWAGMRM
jgi:4-diphosphocytidyl-2-C-methyl-D-erythritol kinase